MIPKSQPVPERLPHRMAVLFFIIYMVTGAFVFVPLPAVKQPHPGRDALQIPETSKLEELAILPADKPVKRRKKVTYLSPPDRARKAGLETDTQAIRSVLVPHAFSYAVVQQPEDEPYYVSSESDLVTEFGLAREHNSIGLLAHNNLAGNSFKYLKLGQEIYIVEKNGKTERYTVSAIYRFQALESSETGSHFVDLKSGKTLTASDVFTQMYTGAPHLTFQTCIYAKGNASWGRLFVIATPVLEAE